MEKKKKSFYEVMSQAQQCCQVKFRHVKQLGCLGSPTGWVTCTSLFGQPRSCQFRQFSASTTSPTGVFLTEELALCMLLVMSSSGCTPGDGGRTSGMPGMWPGWCFICILLQPFSPPSHTLGLSFQDTCVSIVKKKKT